MSLPAHAWRKESAGCSDETEWERNDRQARSGRRGRPWGTPLREAVLAAPLDAVVPVWRSLSSDTETPVSAYLKLRRGGTGFLLESGERDGRLGRYSFMGCGRTRCSGRTWTGARCAPSRGSRRTGARRWMRCASWRAGHAMAGRRAGVSGDGVSRAGGAWAAGDLPGFRGGLVGAFGYDLSRTLERLPWTLPDDTAFPAALFGRYHTVLAFDHARQRMMAVSLLPAASDAASRLESLRGRRVGSRGPGRLRRGHAPAANAGGDRLAGRGPKGAPAEPGAPVRTRGSRTTPPSWRRWRRRCGRSGRGRRSRWCCRVGWRRLRWRPVRPLPGAAPGVPGAVHVLPGVPGGGAGGVVAGDAGAGGGGRGAGVAHRRDPAPGRGPGRGRAAGGGAAGGPEGAVGARDAGGPGSQRPGPGLPARARCTCRASWRWTGSAT
jgi:hypothetical protein